MAERANAAELTTRDSRVCAVVVLGEVDAFVVVLMLIGTEMDESSNGKILASLT